MLPRDDRVARREPDLARRTGLDRDAVGAHRVDTFPCGLSRGGTRFLHGAQVFPGERFTLSLPTGPCMRLEAVWRRRMAVGVYMTGCRFVRKVDSSEEAKEA